MLCLSIYSESAQIVTPHFSLEGVVPTCLQFSVGVSQFSSGVVLQYRSVLFLVAFISLLYCSFVFFVFVSALLDRVLDAVLQWRFSVFFSVVVLYLRLFSFVSALPAKIASCKNVMKCDVRTYVCMYVRRTRPRAIPLAMTIKNYQHAFKYDYGAPLPRPTAAEEFR